MAANGNIPCLAECMKQFWKAKPGPAKIIRPTPEVNPRAPTLYFSVHVFLETKASAVWVVTA